MNTLIVYTHPNEKSLNSSIFNNVKEIIKSNKHEFDIIDLYKENFNPVLVFNENQKRRDLFKDQETEKYRKLIEKAELIIFIYPVWWNEMPAILKGFIDRFLLKILLIN